MTQSELETKRDALVSAIARGVYRVESQGDSVTYQTIEQMQQALSVINAELAIVSGSTVSRVTLVSHCRG